MIGEKDNTGERIPTFSFPNSGFRNASDQSSRRKFLDCLEESRIRLPEAAALPKES